jgi:uncharacterized protein (DUF2336 family)
MKLIAMQWMTRRAAAPKPNNQCRSFRNTIAALPADQSIMAAIAPTHSTMPGGAELIEAKSVARRAAEQAMKLIATERATHLVIATPEPSNLCRFLDWAQKASSDERAKATNALARAYLRSRLPDHLRRGTKACVIAKLDRLRRDAEICLTTMLGDASMLVRYALAEALSDAHDAPRHIITALAGDQPEIAALVLTRSPILSDAELIEWAAIGGESVQMALARRPSLNADVATSLAEMDRREIAMALIQNPNAHLTASVMRRLAERFGEDGEVRCALLERSALPATLRYDLLAAATRAMPPIAAIGLGEKHTERMTHDALEKCAILVVNRCKPDEIRDLMHHLRMIGVLTVALLVRALISGGRGFFTAAAAELTDVAPERIEGFVREPFGSGFAALYRRMGLPQQFLAPFRVALAALEQFDNDDADRVLRPIVSRLIAFCESERSPSLFRLLALLRRFETDAILEETRALAVQAEAQRAEALLSEESAFAAPLVVVEPRFFTLLSHLRCLEAEAALAELDAAYPPFEARRLDISLAA